MNPTNISAETVQAYDTDSSGAIGRDELFVAIDDMEDGTLSKEEYGVVAQAYTKGHGWEEKMFPKGRPDMVMYALIAVAIVIIFLMGKA